jgi:putative transposase
VVSASQRRHVTRYLTSHYPVTVRRACRLGRLSRSSYYSEPIRPARDAALREKIRALARSRVRYGYKRIHILLKREGIHINHKRVHRLYCLEGLQIKAKRPRRHVSSAHRQPPRVRATAPDVAWSMDFVADQTQCGRRFRALTVVDVFTRECLAIEPGQHLGAADVVNTLTAIAAKRRAPRRIYCDNGSEFSGRLVDLWAYANQVTLEFSRPGKPTDNAFIESFNGSLRDECLNIHWFRDLTDAKDKLQAWQREYNGSRPHRSLNNLAPLEYKAKWALKRPENH